MSEINEPVTIIDNGWTLRTFSPVDKKKEKGIILLIHGWTGDENSMWLFTRYLKNDYTFIAPRAPLKAEPSGYGWVPVKPDTWKSIDLFKSAVNDLNAQVSSWLKITGHSMDEPVNLIGFSQGAALALVYSLMFPDQVKRIACLAGFMPDKVTSNLSIGNLQSKKYYVAHGTVDDVIPVQLAKDLRDFLKGAGANVTYCEDPIGHKIGTQGYKGITKFFS